MSLQRKSPYKQMKIKRTISNLLLSAALVGSGFWFVNQKGPEYIKQIIDEYTTSRKQTSLVENTINEDYTDPYEYLKQIEEAQQPIEEQQENSQDNSQEETQEEYNLKYDFDELRKINPNIVGVIEGDIFEGGHLPVVDSSTDEDVQRNLETSFDGNESYLGTVTTDPRNEDNFTGDIYRLWAHHFQGKENDGRMFSSLVNYDNQEFYENHKFLVYYTENGAYIIEIFACIKDNPMEHQIGNLTDEQLKSELESIISNSLISSNVQVDTDDRIMVLTTCPREGSWNAPENYRVSVYAKITPVYEKTMNQKTR